MPAENTSTPLMRLLNGFRVSQAISVAAQLGIADLLKDGPRENDALAATTETNADALYRMLRALAAAGIFREESGRAFSLTELGQGLRSDSGNSVRDWAIFVGSPYYWNAWGLLAHSVRTGENAFQHLHGIDVWAYRQQHPEDSVAFDRAMTAMSRISARAVVDSYDFSGLHRIADIAGGNGYLLATILQANPGVRGILFDQPHVAPGAAQTFEQAGVKDRCEIVGGSFFETVPSGADAYLLKNIIHDWEDSEATAILKTCRQAIAAAGKLLVIEMAVRGPNEGTAGKFMDLNMLVSPGGRERTEDEMRDLLKGAGFALNRSIDTGQDGPQIFEASPA